MILEIRYAIITMKFVWKSSIDANGSLSSSHYSWTTLQTKLNRTTHALVEKSRKKVGASPKRDFHNLNFEHAVSSALILESLLSAVSAKVVVFGTWTKTFIFLCGIFLDAALDSFLSLLGIPHYCVGRTKFITICSRWFVEASAQLDAQ